MMSGLSQQYSSLTQQAADFTGQSQLFGAIANIGFQGLQFGGSSTSTPTATSSAPVYNRENFSRARSGVNLAGGF